MSLGDTNSPVHWKWWSVIQSVEDDEEEDDEHCKEEGIEDIWLTHDIGVLGVRFWWFGVAFWRLLE